MRGMIPRGEFNQLLHQLHLTTRTNGTMYNDPSRIINRKVVVTISMRADKKSTKSHSSYGSTGSRKTIVSKPNICTRHAQYHPHFCASLKPRCTLDYAHRNPCLPEGACQVLPRLPPCPQLVEQPYTLYVRLLF